ncbi:MAG: hypothetical protein ACLR5G_11135 [Eubacteriales bacterium]
MKEPKEKPNYTSIGGQALIEGIMMRGPKRTAMASATRTAKSSSKSSRQPF